VKEYYEARAPEYDDWWLGTGLFEAHERPGWHTEVVELLGAIASLPPMRTLDVACGTGFLTRHLHGEIVGLDQSPAMLQIASARAPFATFIEGDALDLPFENNSFDRVFTSHFYGHLEPLERERFLRQSRQIAPELVVVDAAWREDVELEQWQERVLNDGSSWLVYKRYFTEDMLRDELGGEILFHGRWLTVARVTA
jgi:SAM-dependent methyltransferase